MTPRRGVGPFWPKTKKPKKPKRPKKAHFGPFWGPLGQTLDGIAYSRRKIGLFGPEGGAVHTFLAARAKAAPASFSALALKGAPGVRPLNQNPRGGLKNGQKREQGGAVHTFFRVRVRKTPPYGDRLKTPQNPQKPQKVRESLGSGSKTQCFRPKSLANFACSRNTDFFMSDRKNPALPKIGQKAEKTDQAPSSTF